MPNLLNHLISIIIPVYNAEKYLGKCFHSLDIDEHKDVQVILINDGSSDNSSDICLNFKNKLPKNTVYINKNNNGVSSARNDGILAASGEYIVFVDADDFVSSDYINELHQIIKNDSDLFTFGYNIVDEKDNIVDKSTNNIASLINLNSESCNDIFNLLEYQPWNKVFKRNIINDHNLKFNESMKWSEDIDFISRYLQYVDKIYISDKRLYNYRVNSGGAVSSMNYRAIRCHHIAFQNQLRLLNKKNAELQAYRNLTQSYVEHLGLTIRESYKKGDSITKLKETLKENKIKDDLAYQPNSLSAKFKTICIKKEWISLLLLYYKFRNS